MSPKEIRPAFAAWISFALQLGRGWLRRRPQRKLHLCETLALGEKRSVAVIEFEQLRYLVGCTSGAITLLSQLPIGVEPSTVPKSQPDEGQPCDL